MMPSGKASAALAHYLPSLALSTALLASLPPQTAANSAISLNTTHSVPTIVFSPVCIPSCATSSTRAPLPPFAIADPPSPASQPLSPKKTAGRQASKHPATTLAPQLSLNMAESFLHSLDTPSVPPSGPVTSVGPSGALADLLQSFHLAF
ncbi:hypothetical protein E4T56_gene10346 [Termitomyces sp. T112]|nr:hypothetical protein E4T56_gene10346 [Termitomyces sp. T112]